MPRLDRKLIKELTGKAGTDFANVLTVNASAQSLDEVPALQYLPSLNRLDLSKNQLRALGGVPECTSLRWLNIAQNQLSDIKPVSNLNQLQVLNVGHNLLEGKLSISGLPALCALIANDNAFASLKSVGEAKLLNTLVLKNNRISGLGSALVPCTALLKLSMAHNQLTDLGGSLQSCAALAELRLGHNSLEGLPESLEKNSRLKIVDLGGNPIDNWKSIKVLAKLPNLQNLTLKGTPLSDRSDYKAVVQRHLPNLQILDNQRLGSGTASHANKSVKSPTESAPVGSKGLKRQRESVETPANEQPSKLLKATRSKKAATPAEDAFKTAPLESAKASKKTKAKAALGSQEFTHKQRDEEKAASEKKARVALSHSKPVLEKSKLPESAESVAQIEATEQRQKLKKSSSHKQSQDKAKILWEDTGRAGKGLRGAQVADMLQSGLFDPMANESTALVAPAWER